jgi:hypothetical protein
VNNLGAAVLAAASVAVIVSVGVVPVVSGVLAVRLALR